MTLWLLRHARVELADGLCYGASDVPAHPALTQEAASAAAALVPAGAPVWVSGLGRAQALAVALCQQRPDLGTPATDARLNEMDFGRWELQAWDAVPRSAFDAWMADFARHRFGGAESTQQVIDRVAAALHDLRHQLSTTEATDAVWVTHAGVIRAVQFVLAHGAAPIGCVAQWPRDAPAPGGHLCVDW